MSSVNYAHELGVQTPTQWLWDELEAHLPAEVFAKLKNGYMAQQRRYSRCSVLNKWSLRSQTGRINKMNAAKWRAILADPAAYVFSEESAP